MGWQSSFCKSIICTTFWFTDCAAVFCSEALAILLHCLLISLLDAPMRLA